MQSQPLTDRHAHTFDFACAGLFVKPFWVPLLYNFNRGIDEDFDEAQPSVLVNLSRDGAVRLIRGNERGEGDTGGVGKEFGDLDERRAIVLRTSVRVSLDRGIVRTSPIRRMFSLRDFSSKPKSLFSPKRTLSPSNR